MGSLKPIIVHELLKPIIVHELLKRIIVHELLKQILLVIGRMFGNKIRYCESIFIRWRQLSWFLQNILIH